MSSNRYSPSIRDLLLIVVFQLGICILLLVEVANAIRGYGTLLGLAGQLIGSVTAAGALLAVLVRRRSDTDS